MSMYAIRIPEPLRKEMNHIKINWSDYLRNSITEAIEAEKKRTLIGRIHLLNKKSPPVKSGTSLSIIHSIRRHA